LSEVALETGNNVDIAMDDFQLPVDVGNSASEWVDEIDGNDDEYVVDSEIGHEGRAVHEMRRLALHRYDPSVFFRLLLTICW
jgi:hypothetical protein